MRHLLIYTGDTLQDKEIQVIQRHRLSLDQYLTYLNLWHRYFLDPNLVQGSMLMDHNCLQVTTPKLPYHQVYGLAGDNKACSEVRPCLYRYLNLFESTVKLRHKFLRTRVK